MKSVGGSWRISQRNARFAHYALTGRAFLEHDLRVAQNALARLMNLGYLECQAETYRRA